MTHKKVAPVQVFTLMRRAHLSPTNAAQSSITTKSIFACQKLKMLQRKEGKHPEESGGKVLTTAVSTC